MATGDRKVNIFINRLLSKTALKEQFLDFLSSKVDETMAGFFQGQSGIMDEDAIALSGDGADKFKLGLTAADRVCTAAGVVIRLPDVTDETKGVKFENANGVTYHVGVKYQSVEWNEIQLNPRYGNPEYPSLLESYGEKNAPTSIVNTPGVKIAININSITEANVDHSGRKVKVWLTTPVSGVQSVAFYEGTSYYSGGSNFLDIPYSGANGPLGQDTGSNPPSTTVGDYRVFIKGVTWKRNTDLRLDGNYAYIGNVTGAGAGNPPVTTNITDQHIVFLFTLDKAYDGNGAGLGREILVDAGAVLLTTGASSGDNHNAQLRLNRKNDTGGGAVGLELLLPDASGGQKSIPVAAMTPVSAAGGQVQANEPVTLSAPDLVTFTRGGALNLLSSAGWVHGDLCLLEIRDTSHDGLFFMSGWTANTVTVRTLRTDAAPGFSGGDLTGTATFYRVMFGVSVKPRAGGSELEGTRFVGIDGAGNAHKVKLYPCGNTSALQIFDSQFPVPVERQKVNQRGLLEMQGLHLKPKPLWYTATPDAKDIYHFKLDMSGNVGASHEASARGGQIVDQHGREALRYEVSGRQARGRHFEDDFQKPGHGSGLVSLDPSYVILPWGTNATVRFCDITDTFDRHRGGQILLRSGNAINDFATCWGPQSWYVRESGNNRHTLNFYARAWLPSTTSLFAYIGFADVLFKRVYWGCSTNGTNKWTLIIDDGVNPSTSIQSTITPPFGYVNMTHFWITINPFSVPSGSVVGTVMYYDTVIPAWVKDTVVLNLAAGTSLNNMQLQPFAQIESDVAVEKDWQLDYWETWDTDLRSGDPQIDP